MALQKCYECGNRVSTEAKTCPSCGAPVSAGKKPGLVANLAALVTLILICSGAIFWVTKKAEESKEDLREADRLYAGGNRGAAVAKYKKHFAFVDNKQEILRRIVDFETEKGNKEEARKWIEKGLDAKIAVAYETAGARELHARMAKERQERQEKAGRSGIPSRGEAGYIEVEGENSVWVSIDEKSLEELNAFSRANNEGAIRQMIQAGRVLVCIKGTKVAVVDPGIFSTTVRIMEGQHSGRTGIVPNEFLHK